MWVPGNPFAQMSKYIIRCTYLWGKKKVLLWRYFFKTYDGLQEIQKIYRTVSSFPLWFCGLIRWGWSSGKSYGSRKSLRKLILISLVVSTAEYKDFFFFFKSMYYFRGVPLFRCTEASTPSIRAIENLYFLSVIDSHCWIKCIGRWEDYVVK